jgi:hypothetical protein
MVELIPGVTCGAQKLRRADTIQSMAYVIVHDFYRKVNNSPCLLLSGAGFSQSISPFSAFFRLLYICKDLLSEVLIFFLLMACSQASLAPEILFLRKQLAFYLERKISLADSTMERGC